MLDAMRWLGLDWDEGPEVGGPHAPYRQSERSDLYADVLARLAALVVHLRLLLHHRGGRRASQGVRLQGAGVRRLLPRADRRAGRGVRGRGPQARGPVPDARRLGHLGRPGARRDHLRDRVRPRLRALPRQRRPALHAGQPGRRRADGDHPRAARRGPALQHAAADPAAPRAGRARHLRGCPAVRAPAAGHGRGQQEALQARPSGAPVHVPRPGLPARGPAQLPRPARLGDRRRPRRLHARRDGRGLRHQRRQPQPGPLRPQEGRCHQRLPHAAAADRRHHPPGPAVPQGRRRRQRPGQRRRRPAARAGDAAGRRADQQAHRGGRHARLPLRRRGRLHPRRGRRGQAAERRRAGRRTRVARRRSRGSRSGRRRRSRRPSSRP